MEAILAAIIAALARLVEALRSLLVLLPPRLRVGLGVALVVVVAVGLVVYGLRGNGPDEPEPKAVPYRIGGVDLGGFCDFHRFTQSSIAERSCRDTIVLSKACVWTYDEKHLKAVFSDPKDPYTAKCLRGGKTSLGGIDDLSGYCVATHNTAVKDHMKVTAVVDKTSTWICTSGVDMTDVCRWRYPAAVSAQEDPSGQWSCYAVGSAHGSGG